MGIQATKRGRKDWHRAAQEQVIPGPSTGRRALECSAVRTFLPSPPQGRWRTHTLPACRLGMVSSRAGSGSGRSPSVFQAAKRQRPGSPGRPGSAAAIRTSVSYRTRYEFNRPACLCVSGAGPLGRAEKISAFADAGRALPASGPPRDAVGRSDFLASLVKVSRQLAFWFMRCAFRSGWRCRGRPPRRAFWRSGGAFHSFF